MPKIKSFPPVSRQSSFTFLKKGNMSEAKTSPKANRLRSSLDAVLKKTKSSSFESLFNSSTAKAPRRSSSSLDLLKKAAGKSSTSLRSLFSKQDSASSCTGATDSPVIDDKDVKLFKLYKGSTSLPIHNRRNDLRRDSFELMIRENFDALDGGQYRPRDWSLEEIAMAIGSAKHSSGKHAASSQ